MAHRRIPGDNLRTTYAGAPEVVVDAVPDDRLDVRLSFPSAPLGAPGPRTTTLSFGNVYGFHFSDSVIGLYLGHPHDVEFALIEITDSESVHRILTEGRFADQPGERLGATPEADLRHYRITFDDHGTYDVLCSRLTVGPAAR